MAIPYIPTTVINNVYNIFPYITREIIISFKSFYIGRNNQSISC